MNKRKMVLVAALMLLLPAVAFATAVQFSTSGTVTGASFITYVGTSKHVKSTPAFNVGFGSLKIHCKTTCNAAGASVTITITQSLPGSGTGTVKATLSGTFTKTAGGTLVLAWSGPAKINAGGWITIYNPITSAALCSKGTCSVKLQVDISQVPAPAPEPSAELLLGLGSLGLMGLATLSRKMISV